MKEILSKIHGWLYCNKDPEFLKDIPKLLFSESDIPLINNVLIKNLNKEYDVIYNSGSDSEFHKYHKNWELAKKCFKKMSEAGLKILIIGREKMDDPSEEHKNITLKPFTPYYDFVDYIERSKVCFIPNISDASPRVLTESLIKGVPVIVNKNIFGGWKYVCNKTGLFFEDENDIIDNIKKIIEKVDQKKYNTRQWFLKNYYVEEDNKKIPISGINLRNFILKILNRKGLKSYIKSRMTGIGEAVDENNILSKCDRILYYGKNDIQINTYDTKVLMLNSDHNAQTLNISLGT
jgi:glycosyltransferase involved in cell wall biosynthesis